MGSVILEVKDFVLDEKKIERFGFAGRTQTKINFDFDVIKSGEISEEINAIFRVTLDVEILDSDKEEDNVIASILVELQVASFVHNIEEVNLDDPSEEHLDMAISQLYPVTRSVIANDLQYIKLDHNHLPFNLNWTLNSR